MEATTRCEGCGLPEGRYGCGAAAACMAPSLELDELERLALKATDPAQFSLFRQSASATLRDRVTPEVLVSLIWHIRRLERDVKGGAE